MNQTQATLEYMQKFGSITSFEAFQDLGITRLSDKIFVLRNRGHNIKSETVTTKNRYGNKVTFAKYILEE